MSNYYIVGSKYGDRESGYEDIFPQLVTQSIIAVGFAASTDLTSFIGKDDSTIVSYLSSIGENSDSQSALKVFLNIKPGDLVAVKKHSSPKGSQAQLVISGYAVVEGNNKPVYSHDLNLGHTISVKYIEIDEVTLPFGYGKTIHKIEDPSRISAIFGNYGSVETISQSNQAGITKKTNINPSLAGTRAGYVIVKTHNLMQNDLHKDLVAQYGRDNVHMEYEFIDLLVETGSSLILFEVKTHMSVKYCLREAIGQLLHYDWKLRSNKVVELVVVGPNAATKSDTDLIKSFQSRLNVGLKYVQKSV